MNKKLWFKAKCYGWGWYPASWEGWVVMIIYSFLIAFFIAKIARNPLSSPLIEAILPILLTASLIFVCYKKGEKPSWRWGDKKDK